MKRRCRKNIAPTKSWRFANLFTRQVSVEEQGSAVETDDLSDLQAAYPDNALEIIDFLATALRHRQPIVKYLSDYPDLNDHGFFMVICKLYRDTYRGIGHTPDSMINLIKMFSTTKISGSTATRVLQNGNKAKVFERIRDKEDARNKRYYLRREMIDLCSEAFGSMIEDVVRNRSDAAS